MHSEHSASGLVSVERVGGTGPTVASLVVGVGQRDEPAHLAGITHLTEHLLFRLAEPDALFTDGVTDVSTVSFSASGSLGEAVAFLGRITLAIRNIRDLTDEQINLERKILEAEMAMSYHEAIPSLATVRFGTKGFGLAGAGNPAVATITRHEVIDWVETWFTADNALVTIVGHLDGEAALTLPLGTSPRPARIKDVASITTPVIVPSVKAGVALSLLVSVDDAASLDHALWWEFIQSLRLDRGLCYSVEVHVNRIDQDLASLDVILDPVPDRTGETVVAAITLLRTIADTGFSPAAIERVRQSVAMTRLNPDDVSRLQLENLVGERLLGYSSCDVDEDLARGATVDSKQLGETLRGSLDSLIVMYDEDAEVGDLAALTGIGVDELEPISPISRTEFRSRARSQGSRRWRSNLVPALSRGWATIDNGVLLFSGPMGGWAIDVASAVLLGRRPGENDVVMILGPDGRRFNVWAGDWWRGSSLLDAIVESASCDRVRHFPA